MTYRVTWDGDEHRPVSRELPRGPLAARDAASDIVSRNVAWYGTRWTALNGDEFAFDEEGVFVEATDMERRSER